MLVQDVPHLPGGDWHVDVAHAEVSQRIDYRVHDGLRRADGRRLANTLRADGMVRRWCDGAIRLPVRRLHRGRDQVVLEVAAVDVALLVVGDLLEHGWREALRPVSYTHLTLPTILRV